MAINKKGSYMEKCMKLIWDMRISQPMKKWQKWHLSRQTLGPRSELLDIEYIWTSWVGVRIWSKTTVSGDCWCSADEWLVIGHEETDSWQEYLYLSFFGQFCETRFLNK